MANETQALTKKGKERLIDYLDKHKAAIQAVVPAKLDDQRIVFALENAIRRNYQIAGCTTMSVFNCLATCYRDGLEIAPQEAYLVPFRQGKQNVCTLVYDYRGLIKLAFKAGVIRYMRPFLVREGDSYQWEGNGGLVHIPRPPANTENLTEDIVFGYCRTRLSSGDDLPIDPVWMADLDKVRRQATARLQREDGPWFKWTERMFLKTIVKREFHSVPRREPQLIQAVETDNAYETGQPIPRVIDVEDFDEIVDPEYDDTAAAKQDDGDDMPQRKAK